MGPGALGYSVTLTESGRREGSILEVTVWEPPHRYVVNILNQRSDQFTLECAWRVDPQDSGGVTINFASRLEILVPVDPRRFADIQAKVDQGVAEVGARIPHSLA